MPAGDDRDDRDNQSSAQDRGNKKISNGDENQTLLSVLGHVPMIYIKHKNLFKMHTCCLD